MQFSVWPNMSHTPAEVLDTARWADDNGFHGIWYADHYMPNTGSEKIEPGDVHECWAILPAIAVVTERLRIGSLVSPTSVHHPAVLANRAATVDHLSNGRLVLPVGLGVVDDGGFSRVSGEVTSARERAERVDEALEICDLAWRGEAFSYAGRHHTVEDLVIAPRPVQQPRIPVWPVGGWRSERSMARAARWDGVVLQRTGSEEPLDPVDVADAVSWIAERRGGLAGYDVVVQETLSDDRGRARETAAAAQEAGGTWIIDSRWDTGYTPERLLEIARQGPPSG